MFQARQFAARRVLGSSSNYGWGVQDKEVSTSFMMKIKIYLFASHSLVLLMSLAPACFLRIVIRLNRVKSVEP